MEGKIGEDGEEPREDLESIADRLWKWLIPLSHRENATQTDGLDWAELTAELKNLFKFNAEKRSWLTILKTALIIFATSLAPSLFDMGSDALSTFNFINGTTYTNELYPMHPRWHSPSLGRQFI